MKQFQANEWTRRGKKYKAKTFAALKQLYGKSTYDTDCQFDKKETLEPRENGTDQICDLVKETKLQGSS